MKKFLTWVCLAVFLLVGINAAVTMASLPRTYDGSQANVPVYELRRDPASYDDSTADGAAAGIVQQNLDNVTSVVFDFRGYDTMGEAFILMTAVAGATVILFSKKTAKKEEKNDEEK